MSLNDDLKKAEGYALDEDDITRITQGKSKIVFYEDLYNMSGMDFRGLFQKETNNSIILFYELGEEIGHWVCVILKDGSFQHWDSYGLPVDAELHNKHVELHLSRLYNEVGLPVKANKIRFQKVKKDTLTCGRWSAVRALHPHMNNVQFYDYFKKLNIKSLDDVVTLMTMLIDHRDEGSIES